MTVKLLTEHHLEFLSLKGGCTGSSESTLVKMSHCWKSRHGSNFLLSFSMIVSHSQLNLSDFDGKVEEADNLDGDLDDGINEKMIEDIGGKTLDLDTRQCCPQVRNFEGLFWPPSAFSWGPFEIFRGHILPSVKHYIICFFTKAELVSILCPKSKLEEKRLSCIFPALL